MRVYSSLECKGYLNIDHIGYYTGVIPIDRLSAVDRSCIPRVVRPQNSTVLQWHGPLWLKAKTYPYWLGSGKCECIRHWSARVISI